MGKLYRRNLINSIGGYKSANLIGTKGPSGVNNLAVFFSIIHVGATPPLVGFLNRPTTVERHTYENIKSTGHFTINYIAEDFIQQAHQTSAKYPANVSEFDACELTPWFSPNCESPYVAESPVKIGLEYVEEYPIKANGTIFVIGVIKELFIPEQVIDEEGQIDLPALGTVAISGLNRYYKAERLAEFPFARP